MKEQLTEHVFQEGEEFFWEAHDRRHKPSPLGEVIARELADALREERKRSARYRAALLEYADEQKWMQQWDGSKGIGSRNCFIPYLPEGPGWNIATEALLQADGEEAENVTKTSE